MEEQFTKLGGICPAAGDGFVPLTTEEAGKLEQRLGASLPESYKSFVFCYGRSAFNEYVDFMPVQPFDDTPTGKGHFGLFFGGDSPTHKSYSLSWNLQTYTGRVPAELLPIGGDGGGDLICLGIKGTHRGRVYYWDHTNEPLDEEDYLEDHGKPMPTEARWGNVKHIAESFHDFLQRLEVGDE